MAGFVQSLITAQGAGASLASSTSATSIIPAGAKFTLPQNYLDFIGRKIRISAQGAISNIVTTPGTLTIDVRFGATIVFNGGAMQLSTTAHTTVPWWLDIELTVRAIGASANVIGQGRFMSQAVSVSGADPTTGHSMLLIPNTNPTVGSNFDSTATQAVDLFATFSISDAANALQLTQYELLCNVF